MKTVTFVLFLSFYWALHTQAQTEISIVIA